MDKWLVFQTEKQVGPVRTGRGEETVTESCMILLEEFRIWERDKAWDYARKKKAELQAKVVVIKGYVI